MSGVDTRNISRDSLFLMGDVQIEGNPMPQRVKVRNLSAGGMMADGDLPVVPGRKLTIELRNIGCVEGVVAWVQDGRFGIAFTKEIDPKLARAPVAQSTDAAAPPRFTRPSSLIPEHAQYDPNRLRKV